MEAAYILFVAVKSFLDERIRVKYNDMIYTCEKKDSVYLIELIDKNSARIKLTFVFWDESSRVSILIEDYEIDDDEFNNTDDLIEIINVLISGEVIKTEKYKGAKIIYRQYEYSMLIDGKKKIIKDESQLGCSWLGKPENKVTRFSPW